MSDADVQGMLVRIEATTAQLRQEIARGEASVAQAANKIDSSLGQVDKAFDRTEAGASVLQKAVSSAFTGIGIAAAASVAGLVAITVKTTEYAQEVKNLAALSNTSVVDFQRLAAGAKTVGIEQDKLSDIYKDTNDRIGEFLQRGGGEMADFFKEIAPQVGVTAQQFAKLSGPEALQLYYNSLEKAGLSQQKMTTYLEAVADEATGLIPLLKNNGEGFRTFGDQAQKTGKILSEFEVDRLVQADLAVKNLQASFDGASRQLVVGLLPSIEDVTQRLTDLSNNGGLEALGSTISFLVDHFNILVAVMGGKVAAAFASYVGKLATSTAASLEARAANIAQAASAVEVSLANQQAAQTAVVRAEKEAIAARGTAVQTQLSIQLAEARVAERAATAGVATAQAGLKAASSGLLALLGGPAGIVALVAGAAIAFVTLKDNSSALEKKLGDLADPVDKLAERFNKLNRASQAVTLRELRSEIDETKSKLAQVSGSIADKFENDLRNVGAAGADGFMSGLVALPDDAQQALDLVRKASKDAAAGLTVDWKAVADQVRTIPGVTEEMAQALETGQVKSSDLSATLQHQQSTLNSLTAEVERNTQAQNSNTQSKVGASAAGAAYIDTLTKALHSAQDTTAVQAANRFISENADLTKDQIKQILELATAKDAATKATKDGNKAEQDATTEAKNRSKALADLKAEADIAIKSAEGLGAAYLSGVDKSRLYAQQQKVEEALLKTGAAARDEVTSKIKAQLDAQDRLAVSKAAYDLSTETAGLLAQAQATVQGTAALEQYNVQKAMQVALAGKNIEVGSKEYQQLLEATKAQQDAIKVAKQASDAGSIIDRLYPASKLLRDYTEDQAALNKAMELYPERADAYRDALQRLSLEYQQNQQSASAWGKFTEGAVDRIDEAFADMWKSVLTKSGNFMDTLKNSFRQFLAELLHLALTKPIIVQFASALGIGGAAMQSSGFFGDVSGGGGIGSLLSGARNVISVAGSSFGKAILAGWNSGDGLFGGIEGAFGNGADYIKTAITSAFTTGSATASNAAASLAAGSTQAGYTGAQFGNWTATANVSSNLASLSSTLSYIGAVYSVISSFQQYGLKGGATTAGFAAAGAAIGSVVPVIGTAVGAALGAVLGSFASGKLFSSGEKYADLSTSGSGVYENGKYNSTGVVQNWQTKAPKFGTATDLAVDATINKFTTTLGMLYDTLGTGSSSRVYAYDLMQIRKTSGRYSTTFGATLDGTGTGLDFHQQFNAADAAEALQHNYDDILGTFLAKAIVSSKTLPDYFRSQFTEFANSWDTTADEVIKAIEGVFTRFNGVNDALTLINVNNLKLDNTGLMASDAILDMIGAMSNLDTATASAKDKVDALNKAVGTYYQAFFTADEQFADLTKSLKTTFAGLGLELPDTRAAYRKMVEDINVTTAAGQAMFATLVGLATNADSYYSTLEQKAKDAQQAALDAQNAAAEAAADAAQKIRDNLMQAATNSFSALQRAISAQQKAATETYNALTASLNDMLSTANTKVSDLTAVGDNLSKALKALRGDSDSAVKMLRSQAQATLQSALATAKAGGSLAGFVGLSDALDAVGANSTDLYTSLEDFNRDQGRTASVIAQLDALNGKQLSSAEQSAKALQDQLDQAKKAYDAQMAQYETQLAIGQAQIDALNGVDTSVLSVADAVNRMNAAVVAALGVLPGTGAGSASGNTWENNAALVHTAYQTAFGRDADVGGLRFWTDALQSGSLTYDQFIAQLVKVGRQNGESIKIPGYASGGLFSGGIRLVGENGPELEVTGPSRIHDARTTAAMLSGGSNAAVVAELRALRGELESIKANTQASAVSASKLGRVVDRVTDGGNAMLTKELA